MSVEEVDESPANRGEDLPDPPHVIMVSRRLASDGGQERVVSKLVERLLARGHPVTVVAHECELKPRPGLVWHRVRGIRRPASLAYPLFVAAASLAVWRGGPGIVHSHGALLLGRSDVCTIHYVHQAALRESASRASRASTAYRLNAWLAGVMARFGERWVYRPTRTGRLVALSSGGARELEEQFPSMRARIDVIPNGVDTVAFKPDRRTRAAVRRQLDIGLDERIALFVGGDWQRKGLRYAIEALEVSTRWTLVVVGRGDEARYGAMADRLGVGRRVRFLGHRPDTAPYFAAADAFVSPSAYESFSLVVLEAAATGLALLVTPVSGAEELLVEGENGWFIERDGAYVAKRLDALAGDPSLIEHMGRSAREAAFRYDWERVADAYAGLYARVDIF